MQKDSPQINLEISEIDISALTKKTDFICKKIEEFNKGSEEEFITIGTELEKYFSNSLQLTNFASNSASSISEEIINKGISQLTTLLKEFKYYVEITTEVIKNDRMELLNILPDVLSILEHLKGFDKIVKQLRMQGISTKIESARLGAEDQGFYVLADTVDKLSGLINEKAKTILDKSKNLITELNRTTANLDKLEKDQGGRSNIIINKITHSIEAFKLKYDRKFQGTEKISSFFEGVSNNINEIVTLVQFHDITRQRLEHTKSALLELSVEIDTKDKFRSIEDTLGRIYDVTILELTQIKNAIDEFQKAVIKITDSLLGVERNITGMLEETIYVLLEDGQEDKDSLKNISIELSVIAEGLKKNVEIGNELSISINSVISIVENLSKFVLEIEDIGTEIELIALNARVKAAHTGKSGAALGVLSESIQRLSIDAKFQTSDTSKILNNISNKSKNLRGSLEKGTYKLDGQKLIASTDKISELIFCLTDLEKKAEENIEKLSNEVSKLKDDIYNTARDLTVNEEASKLYFDVKREFDFILDSIKAYGNYNSDLENHTNSMMNKYTMEHERSIHKNVAKLHEKGNQKEYIIDNTSQENFLGDNVELF